MPARTQQTPSLADTLKALGHSDAVIEAMLGAAVKATASEARSTLATQVEAAVMPALDDLLEEFKAQIKRSGKSAWTGAAVSWALDERFSLKVTLTDKVATGEASAALKADKESAPKPADDPQARLEAVIGG